MYLVITTTDSEQEAMSLARKAVEEGLAACVQISQPITSLYKWEGKAEVATEYRLNYKVCSEKLAQVQSFIENVHSYDTPEIITIGIDDVNSGYLEWACDSGETNGN